SPEEVRFWIVYGRAGTPMPANGLEGGGAMSVQEVDQVLAYITANQISQEDALAKTETQVTLARNRMAAGDERVAELIAIQEAEIADVQAAAAKMEVVGDLPETIEDLLSADGTCTDRSAELVTTTCSRPGPDADRDGLTDPAESALTDYAAVTLETLPILQQDGTYADNAAYAVSFDPANPFTNAATDGSPVPDLDAATTFLETLEADVLVVGVTAEREEQFLAGLFDGLAFLERSAELRLWDVDFAQVQRDMNEQQGIDWEYAVANPPEGEETPPQFLVGGDQATRAVGLFNAYCARCHSGGYSAGSPFETGHGTGAWGPSLIGGRSIVQFPNWLDQVGFIIDGSQNAVSYGINGLGSGRMPGFGRVLTEQDIQLIVMYERTL
ncbi:MAG: cytochrome c, partial [Actinobacteria bacterium]